MFGVKNYLKTFELVYLRTEFLLLELETFNEVKCGIIWSDAHWLQADELKLMMEVIPVLVVNVVILVLLYFLFSLVGSGLNRS